MTSRHDPPAPERLLAAHAAAAEFYCSHLLDEPRAVAYLHSRGIIAAHAHTTPWTIGYAPRSWTALREHLSAAAFTNEELLAAGLLTIAPRTGGIIDTFRDRVIFPIRDRQGRVVAFTGRDLSGRDGTPKYRNTTTTAIYRKSELLFGLPEQLDGLPRPAAVVLVEGPADVVAVARLRAPTTGRVPEQPYLAVAPCGTALTAQQVTLLASAVPAGTPIISAFDADTAGAKAIDRSYQLLRDWPGPVEAMALPAGTDPAALVAGGTTRAVAAFRQARMPLVDLVVDHWLAPYLAKLDTRVQELTGLDRDPSFESTLIRLQAVASAAELFAQLPERDRDQIGRLVLHVATRLELPPLTVWEAVYPPVEELEAPAPPFAPAPPPPPAEQEPAVALGGAGFPDPDEVRHAYARTCPRSAPAETWVQHDRLTGHTAWVLAEAAQDTPAGLAAARLAAAVAGRAAILVGAQKAVQIARTALTAQFSGSDPTDATITVLTIDGDRQQAAPGAVTLAWAGDAHAYAGPVAGVGFMPLTGDRATSAAQPVRDVFTALVDHADLATEQPTTRQRQLVAQATRRSWLAAADPLDLAAVWRTARAHEHHLPGARSAAEAVEQRLRKLYPQPMERYDQARLDGTAPQSAMRRAVLDPPWSDRAAEPVGSVRRGPIGLTRIAGPASRILLAGHALHTVDTARLWQAVDGRRLDAALGNLRQLGGRGTVAMLVSPHSDRTAAAVTAPQLARQDQATPDPPPTRPRPSPRPRRLSPSPDGAHVPAR